MVSLSTFALAAASFHFDKSTNTKRSDEEMTKKKGEAIQPLPLASILIALLLGVALLQLELAHGFNPFVGFLKKAGQHKGDHRPCLVLIGGSPGTGKSTFGMSVALDLGILKCISTDTVRAVMRSFVPEDVSPALHRSSYEPAFENDDPVRSWKESCKVLENSIHGLVLDAIDRKVSLVVEGVHLVPSRSLIEQWEESGGVALGCLLQVTDPETHKRLLERRGFITGNMASESRKIQSYERIRAIQDEMIRKADEAGWLRIEQKTELDPVDVICAKLYGISLDDDANATTLEPPEDLEQPSIMLRGKHPAEETYLTESEREEEQEFA